MIGSGAKVDGANRMGETPLIVAVQNRKMLSAGRQLTMVRTLLNAGANPDKTDFAAGYSARDYAKRDSRGSEVLRAIEAPKAAKAAGPSL